jgi:hypothetical protein
VSSGTRFVAGETNATQRPSALIAALVAFAALAGPPPVGTLATSVVWV